MLEIKNVFSGYEQIDYIKAIDITIQKGECFYIIGPNGSGKTTLLKAIAHLIPYRGNIILDGEHIGMLERKCLAMRIALMSQRASIYFPYTVYETVALGRYAYRKGMFRQLDRIDKEKIEESLYAVGLYEERNTLITHLSGGQLQRALLARTFVQNPKVILLDEPTNHLDLKYQLELLQHLKNWAKEKGKIVVGVLHDLNLVQCFADRVALLQGGEIVAQGKTEKVLTQSQLLKVYETDVQHFMKQALKKWEK